MLYTIIFTCYWHGMFMFLLVMHMVYARYIQYILHSFTWYAHVVFHMLCTWFTHVIYNIFYMLFTWCSHVIYMLFTCYAHIYIHVAYMLYTCYIYIYVVYMLHTCYIHVWSCCIGMFPLPSVSGSPRAWPQTSPWGARLWGEQIHGFKR